MCTPSRTDKYDKISITCKWINFFLDAHFDKAQGLASADKRLSSKSFIYLLKFLSNCQGFLSRVSTVRSHYGFPHVAYSFITIKLSLFSLNNHLQSRPAIYESKAIYENFDFNDFWVNIISDTTESKVGNEGKKINWNLTIDGEARSNNHIAETKWNN